MGNLWSNIPVFAACYLVVLTGFYHKPQSVLHTGLLFRELVHASTQVSNRALIKVVNFCLPDILYCFKLTTFVGLGDHIGFHWACQINIGWKTDLLAFCFTIPGRRGVFSVRHNIHPHNTYIPVNETQTSHELCLIIPIFIQIFIFTLSTIAFHYPPTQSVAPLGLYQQILKSQCIYSHIKKSKKIFSPPSDHFSLSYAYDLESSDGTSQGTQALCQSLSWLYYRTIRLGD